MRIGKKGNLITQKRLLHRCCVIVAVFGHSFHLNLDCTYTYNTSKTFCVCVRHIKNIFFCEAFTQLLKYRVRKKTFFLENILKQTYGMYSQISFLFESTILPVNNGK